jgi:PAS domain S-box-containing protein
VIGVNGVAQDVTEVKAARKKEAQLQRRLQAMWNIGRMVDADFISLNKGVLFETLAMTESRHGFFGYLNEDESILTITAWSKTMIPAGATDEKPMALRVADAGLWAEAVRCREVLIVNDYQAEHPAKIGLPPGHVPLTRVMVVPVFSRDRIVSLCAVASKESEYTADDAGQVAAFLNNVQIVLEKRRAEESVALLSQAVEQSPVSIVITDTESNIQFVNPEFTRLTGYGRDEVLGRNPGFMKSGVVPAAVYRTMWATISSGGTWTGEFVNRKKNGEIIREAAAISPVKNREGAITHYVAVKEDITEQTLLEEQLRHAQKMEAVGTLAGGIAHDFNNILTTVFSHCALMERRLAEGDPLRGYVAKVVGAAERAASLTRALLTYSRKQPAETRPVNMNDLLLQAEHLLSRLLSEDIELRIERCETPLQVLADPVQIEQVLMNLASNARDAMIDGGAITISTALASFSQDCAGARVREGRYCLITVADNGTGMEPAVRERIFEPFFTTKEVGKGSGLGLSITYGIIEQHGGHIDVESTPGKGTTFAIYLPLVEGAGRKAVERVLPVPEPGTEGILLVEDDDQIREIFEEVLSEAGYRVVTAADGEEGISKFRERQDDIQLLILDVIMPKKNGVKVYETVKRESPTVKALFISGYAPEMLNERARLIDHSVVIVPKPITPDLLLTKVREVLDAK